MPIQLTLMSLDFESFEEPITKTIEKDEIIIGRKLSCDVVLNRPEVSQQHCKLRVSQDANGPVLLVTDMGSANGTMIERDLVPAFKEIAIQTNQRIIVGSYLIKPLHFAALEKSPEAVEAPSPQPAPVELATTKKLTAKSVPIAPAKARPVPAPIPAPIAVQLKHPVELNGAQEEVALEVVAGGLLDLNFDALKLVAIHGQVFHGDSPLADVEVDAGKLGRAKTGADGIFSFADVPEGEAFTLRFHKEKFVLEPAEISGTANEQALQPVRAKGIRQITGRVTHHGQPLAGVLVAGGDLGERTTGSDGTFVFEGLLEGKAYALTATKEKFRFTSIAESGYLNGSDAEVAFVGTELVTVSGKILHAGQPLAGVEIEAYEIGKATTDESGFYRFENVPEGTKFKLKVSKPGFRFNRSQSMQ